MTETAAWSPIETAPFGVDVLVYLWGDMVVMKSCRNEKGEVCWRDSFGSAAPSHWMPLPSPPNNKPMTYRDIKIIAAQRYADACYKTITRLKAEGAADCFIVAEQKAAARHSMDARQMAHPDFTW